MYYTGKLYKYTTGEVKLFNTAQKELINIHELGYSDAYITKVSEYFSK